MKQQGTTLFELLTTLTIATLLVSLAIPGFDKLIKNSRLNTAATELLHAIEKTRSTSVLNGKRAVLRAEKDGWHKGWALFIDENDDGVLNEKEEYIYQHEALKGMVAKGNHHIKELISFIPSGEARGAGKANGGVITVGKLAICPEKEEEGYQIVLSKGGRSRMEKLTAAECKLAKQGSF